MASQEPDQDEDAVLSYDFSIHELPPIKIYTSRAKAFEDVNKWAKPKGYAFTNGGSKKKHGLRKAIFLCDKNGPKPVEGPPKEKGQGRNKPSKGEECKYSIICKEKKDGTWELRYREPWKNSDGVETNFCIHSHEATSGTGTEHPVLRRLQRRGEREEAIVNQMNSGQKTRNIKDFLKDKYNKKDEESDLAKLQDIRNAIYKERRERKAGRNTTQTLVEELEGKEDWISRPTYREDEPNRLHSMQFCYIPLLEYARLYCSVFILDFTYSTNSSDMPLFEAIAIDATGRSVCTTFEFTEAEDEEDCIQSLRNLREMLGEEVSCKGGVMLSDKADAIRNAIAIGT
jgi:hypothetical protein